MPAVQYYSRHGDLDGKLKAYFCFGNIYLNTRRFDKAAFSYSLAEAEAEKATDEVQKGIHFFGLHCNEHLLIAQGCLHLLKNPTIPL